MVISSSGVFAATSVINNKKYTHPAFYKVSLHKLFHGVDVSVWQGAINWKKSKAAGIDFAILRCGYTALNSFTLHQDSTFATNYKDAKKAGVSVGIYYYACATTSTEAKKEANYVISILKNNKVNNQLPVVMDYEIDSGRANTVYKKLVNKKGKAYARKRFTRNARVFMNTLKASGYSSMFYSYRMMVDPKVSANYRFNMSDINGSNQYRFWLAQYSTSNSYSGKMEIWQFSSTGRVSGMKGNIDRNFWYYPLSGTKTESGTKSIRQCKVTLGATQYKYDGTIKQPSVKVTDDGDTLKNGTDYSVSYMNNIKKGTATVLIHGKGDYSNETYGTFKIADKNIGTDTSTVVDEPEDTDTPSKVTGLKASYNISAGRMKLTWSKADNATRYLVAYRINGAEKLTKVKTGETSYTLTDLKPGSIVEILVRGQNVMESKTVSGKYSKRQYLYFATTDCKTKVLKGSKIKAYWDPAPNQMKKLGQVEYKVVFNCVDIAEKMYSTSNTYKKYSAKERYCYNVAAKPTVVYNGHTYSGRYGTVAHAYVIYGSIKTATPIAGGFKITYPKTTGIGDPRYRIVYSQDKDFKNAKSTTRPQGTTTCKVKNLVSGKTYYVKMQTYKKLHNITYFGVMSPVVKVTAK